MLKVCTSNYTANSIISIHELIYIVCLPIFNYTHIVVFLQELPRVFGWHCEKGPKVDQLKPKLQSSDGGNLWC